MVPTGEVIYSTKNVGTFKAVNYKIIPNSFDFSSDARHNTGTVFNLTTLCTRVVIILKLTNTYKIL